jgi:hypothetical protein
MSPFAFLGLPLFSSEIVLMSPFVFSLFFHRRSFYELLCIFLGCLFFHRMSVVMSPFAFFWVASFFTRGLF